MWDRQRIQPSTGPSRPFTPQRRLAPSPVKPDGMHGEPCYLLLIGGEPPRRWASRARPAVLVPLLPAEAHAVLAEETVQPISLPPEDEQLARLVAAGTPITAMPRILHVSLRTVQRRLARLRTAVGAADTAALAEQLRAVGLG